METTAVILGLYRDYGGLYLNSLKGVAHGNAVLPGQFFKTLLPCFGVPRHSRTSKQSSKILGTSTV